MPRRKYFTRRNPEFLGAECEQSQRVRKLLSKFSSAEEFATANLGGFGAKNVSAIVGIIDAASRTRLNLNQVRQQVAAGGDWYFLHKIPVTAVDASTHGEVIPTGKEDLTKPIVIGSERKVLDGRHRVMLAQELGIKELPTYMPAKLLYQIFIDAPRWRRRNPDQPGYLYHVTYAKDLSSIAQHGLVAQAPASGLGRGGYAHHSAGHNFLTEGHGISFWASRMEDHARDQWDDLHQAEAVPLVLRIWIEAYADDLVEDKAGSRDSGSDCYMTPEDIDDLDDIDIWTGSHWVNITDYGQVDWEAGLEREDDPDDPDNYWWSLIDPSPFIPPEDSWGDEPVEINPSNEGRRNIKYYRRNAEEEEEEEEEFQRIISTVIRQVIQDWHTDPEMGQWVGPATNRTWQRYDEMTYGEAVYRINDGDCCEFAAEVIKRMGGYSPVLGENVTPTDLWETGYPGHEWIEYRGRAYDAETPQGVDNWRDLPIFKKYLDS